MHLLSVANRHLRSSVGSHRSALSPERLRGTFEPPYDHIKTLHDNWETSVKEHAQVSLPRPHSYMCLGYDVCGVRGV